jgi:ribosomal protein L11 methyltransferase
MPWLALTLELERAAAEPFSDALLEAGAQSVALEGGRVSALLELQADPAALVSQAAHSAGMAAPSFTMQRIDDRDWVRESQAQFRPIEVGARLWVGPHWHQPPRGRVAVRIDPGLAFGTGSHASTKLALGFLDKAIRGGERVLDYGCGSGILAIAALRLGAAHADAVDTDPQAVQTTRENAQANGVALRAGAPEALAPAQYDLVVANILAQPLIVLAPLLATRAPRVALSGILEHQAREVADAYAPWLPLQISSKEEGWVLLEGARA